MSKRLVHRLDMIIAIGRWMSLLGVLIVTLVTLSFAPDSAVWTALTVTAIAAVVGAIPVVLLYFRLYHDAVALTFVVLDSVYTGYALLGRAGCIVLWIFAGDIVRCAFRLDNGAGRCWVLDGGPRVDCRHSVWFRERGPGAVRCLFPGVRLVGCGCVGRNVG